MLQRLLSYDDDEFGDGLWSHQQLLEMNDRFTAAVEAAFQSGLESRKAAAATVRIGRNGKEAAIESAIEAAWDLLCSKKGDVAFSEIVAFVRERCPNIDQARVRFGFQQRFRQRGHELWA